jgi:outer membrane protein
MKNLSIVLNIVLLVAVIVLYVLYFTNGKGSSRSSSAADTSSLNLKIAYINSDSVLKYYDYLKVNREQLEAKSQKMGQDYQNRAMGLQNEITAYQRNVSSMTLGQARALEEDLGKKQQNLQMYQQTLEQQAMMDQEKLSKELYGRITAFCKKYGQERSLQYVLKFDQSSDVLYGVGGLDISKEVVNGLNEEYKIEKTVPAKKDTVKTK